MPDLLISVSDRVGLFPSLPLDVFDTVTVTEPPPSLAGLTAPSARTPSVFDTVTVTESVAGGQLTDGAFRQGRLANATQVTLPYAVVGRNTIAVYVRWQSATINLTSISDDKGNLYTLVQNPITSASGARAAAAVAADVVG